MERVNASRHAGDRARPRRGAWVALGLGMVLAGTAPVPGMGIVPWVGPAGLSAQEPVIEERSLTDEARDEVFEFLNADGTMVLPGGATLPAGTSVSGDLAVVGGDLRLGGRVAGRVVVVNGDLHFAAGSGVAGDVQVVGGRVEGLDGARLDGSLGIYDEALRYVRRDGRLEPAPERQLAPTDVGLDLGWARARFSARAGTNYNRVEGLPVLFGPRIETRGRNPFEVELFGIWRSNRGLSFDRRDLGYRVGVTQWLGGRRVYAVGATGYSEIAPLEQWGVSDLEASLATFFLRRDFRDYLEREGWTVHADWVPHAAPLRLRAEYRDERHAFVPVRGAWALRDEEDRPWRPQPLVAEGRFQSAGLELEVDRRNDPDRPADGWLARISLRAGLSGSLEVPAHQLVEGADGDPVPPDLEGETVGPHPVDHDRSFGTLDLRRYFRLSPWSSVAFRAVLAGSVAGGALPPQFQSALGGVGSVPGRPAFSGDCGARATVARLPGRGGNGASDATVHPSYGCDRLALVQAEYRGRLPFRWNPLPEEWESEEWAGALELEPRWAFFANVGRGWSLSGNPTPLPRHDTETMADVGAGVFLGALGVYGAVPVSGEGRRPNLFIRLTHRF